MGRRARVEGQIPETQIKMNLREINNNQLPLNYAKQITKPQLAVGKSNQSRKANYNELQSNTTNYA